jgi:hypothetical protein
MLDRFGPNVRETEFSEVTLPGCKENERGARGYRSPGSSLVLSRWLARVLLYLFIEVVMNSLMEGAFTSVNTVGSVSPHPHPKAVIPY